MESLAAFIITYRRSAALRRHISVLLSQTVVPQHTLVIDNASDEGARAVVREFAAAGAPIAYLDAGDNLGPAGAAALGIRRLVEQGYEWVLWADDDDPPPGPTVLGDLLNLSSRFHAPDHVGALGLVGQRWDWGAGQMLRLPNDHLTGVVEVDSVAGGQQFVIHRRAVELVGLPATELFFGYEEREFCLRMRRAGLSILVDGARMYELREWHGRLGLPAKNRRISRRVEADSLWRAYYSSRNYVYMMRRSFGRPDLARRECARALVRTLGAVRHGPRHASRVGMTHVRAIRDGYRGRMGRTVEPVAKQAGS